MYAHIHSLIHIRNVTHPRLSRRASVAALGRYTLGLSEQAGPYCVPTTVSRATRTPGTQRCPASAALQEPPDYGKGLFCPAERPSPDSKHSKLLSACQLTNIMPASAEGTASCPSVYLWPRLGENRASAQPPLLSRPSGETTSTLPSSCLLSLSL